MTRALARFAPAAALVGALACAGAPSRPPEERALERALGAWASLGCRPPVEVSIARVANWPADWPADALAAQVTVRRGGAVAEQRIALNAGLLRAGGYDEATVILHEVGHAVGLGHSPSGLMAERLPPGTRVAPGPADGAACRALAAGGASTRPVPTAAAPPGSGTPPRPAS